MPTILRGVTIVEGLPRTQGQEIRMLEDLLVMADFQCEPKRCYTRSLFLRTLFETKHRFLHISAHGDGEELEIGGKRTQIVTCEHMQAYLKCNGLRKPLRSHLVTLSSCADISNVFVGDFHKVTGVTAVLSPMSTIDFADSAMFSMLFYYSLAFSPSLSRLSREKIDDQEINTTGRISQFIDSFQRAKIAYLGVGGRGAHRLFYWHGDEQGMVT